MTLGRYPLQRRCQTANAPSSLGPCRNSKRCTRGDALPSDPSRGQMLCTTHGASRFSPMRVGFEPRSGLIDQPIAALSSVRALGALAPVVRHIEFSTPDTPSKVFCGLLIGVVNVPGILPVVHSLTHAHFQAFKLRLPVQNSASTWP